MNPINKSGSLLPFLLGSMFLLLLSCSEKAPLANASPTVEKANNSQVQTVEVVRPMPGDFTAEVLITGTAMPNQMVKIYAMESGFLKEIRKDIGDYVRKGEVIAVLDNPDLRRKKQKIAVRIPPKKSTFLRLLSVKEKSPALTSLQEVEEAESEYLSLKAELDAIKDRISFLTVKAPFSGTITKRFVDKGALLQSGLDQSNPQVIVEIQETNPIRLSIALPESDASAAQKGMEVSVSFPELPGESYIAKISRMAKALDPASKTMQVQIDLDNPEGKILTGMYAQVLMRIGSRSEVLSLPMGAKIMYQDEPHALVVVDETVKRIPLQTGLTGKDHFELLNANITSESLVIVKGKSLVRPGQKVEAVLKQE